MGHKNSKQRNRLQSKPECTEIVDFEWSVAEPKEDAINETAAKEKEEEEEEQEPVPVEYPPALQKILESLKKIKTDIIEMSNEQIDLYFATYKDELHNNWRNIYGMKFTDPRLTKMKVAVIEDIKEQLKDLNGRVLNRTIRERRK
ncbi:uncharacterized protein LOC126266533 [Aethina tumida]|uniref:uncharacterized protein LOC126266533 n=1 Tax=Aethina tumida TaxID=116153 RepID=UPI002147E945|nr:uncharacterized protein LOC126266533 [Aethina tumida]